jgi:hypothetical protein
MQSLRATERHYTPIELGELWHLAPSKVRDLFAEEPGVLRIGEPSRREGRKLTRGYFTVRIPESVAVRVHSRLSGQASVRRRAR